MRKFDDATQARATRGRVARRRAALRRPSQAFDDVLALDPSNTRVQELSRRPVRARPCAAVELLRQIAKLRPDSFEAQRNSESASLTWTRWRPGDRSPNPRLSSKTWCRPLHNQPPSHALPPKAGRPHEDRASRRHRLHLHLRGHLDDVYRLSAPASTARTGTRGLDAARSFDKLRLHAAGLGDPHHACSRGAGIRRRHPCGRPVGGNV